MKRLITFVVLFVLGLASTGAAQTKRYSVEQVNELLKAQGIDAVVVAPEATRPTVVVPTNRTAPAPVVAQQPAVPKPAPESLQDQLARAYARKTGARSIDEFNAAVGEISLMENSRHVANLQIQQMYGQMYNNVYNSGPFGYQYPLYQESMRGHYIRGEKGLLGFVCGNGMGETCKKSILYVDGCRVSTIDELLKGPFKGKLPLDRGGRQVTIRTGLTPDSYYYQDMVKIEPRAVGQAVGGEKYTNIRVEPDLFVLQGVPAMQACQP